MKKISIILLLSIVTMLNAENGNLALAIRYIKLGNTYREGKDFDNAAKFLSKGRNIALKYKSFEGKYWTAASLESLGYLYRDMGMQEESVKNLNSALEIYKSVIKQSDGSQAALLGVINKISSLNDLSSSSNSAYPSDDIIGLSSKKLKELPNDIPQNANSLILKDNRFRNFPEGILRMSSLQYLDLSENRLKNISDGIGTLKKLEYLDLNTNKIEEIPASIANLQNLKVLNLENNRLKELRFELCNLKQLKILNLRSNKLDFQEVLKLVRCLPNTNILFDKYNEEEETEPETGSEEL